MEIARLTPDQRTIRDQRERIDELEEELRQAKEQVDPVVFFPSEWGLCLSLAKGLHALYSAPGGGLTHQRLFRAMASWADCEPAELVRVQICRLRQHLKPFGIEINTRWGSGYELTAASKVIIKAALEQRVSA